MMVCRGPDDISFLQLKSFQMLISTEELSKCVGIKIIANTLF